MKKILMLLLTVVGIASTPSLVEANLFNGGSAYIGPIVGANWLQTNNSKHHHSDSDFGRRLDFETGYAVGGFVGYQFCGGFDVEAEFIYRHNELKSRRECDDFSSFRLKGSFQSMSYMLNGIYDINLSNCGCCLPIFPYVGVGIGYAQQELKLCSCKFKNNGFAWQVLAGIGYKINCNFDVALDYHFNECTSRRGGHHHSDSSDNFRGPRVYNHSLSLAAAYHFSL